MSNDIIMPVIKINKVKEYSMQVNSTNQFLEQLDHLDCHTNSQSWANWNLGEYGQPALKSIYTQRKESILPLFEQCIQLMNEHKGQSICGFFSQPSIVGPIGDIMTEFYRQKENRHLDFPVLFTSTNMLGGTAAQFIEKNPSIDDMCTLNHRDNLISITLSFFRDMRLIDSAMDIFLRNTCGRNKSFNSTHHLNKERVKAIILEEVIETEFGLVPTHETYQRAKPELIDLIEKIISIAEQSEEGIINFLAIPRSLIEDSEKSLFYPSVSKGRPVKLSDNTAERKAFFDSLQSAPHELKIKEPGNQETVCPQGRFLRRALSKENDRIKVVRLTTMRPLQQARYKLYIRTLVEKILLVKTHLAPLNCP